MDERRQRKNMTPDKRLKQGAGTQLIQWFDCDLPFVNVAWVMHC